MKRTKKVKAAPELQQALEEQRAAFAATVSGGEVCPPAGVEVDAEAAWPAVGAARVARGPFVAFLAAIGQPPGQQRRQGSEGGPVDGVK